MRVARRGGGRREDDDDDGAPCPNCGDLRRAPAEQEPWTRKAFGRPTSGASCSARRPPTFLLEALDEGLAGQAARGGRCGGVDGHPRFQAEAPSGRFL
jgi:hypothetical protein